MGDKRWARKGMKTLALLLAALLLCAMLPAGAETGVNFTFDLSAVESFDDAVTPEPTVAPEAAVPEVPEDEPLAVPEDEPLAVPEDEPLAVPEDVPVDVPLDTPAEASAENVAPAETSTADGDASFTFVDGDASTFFDQGEAANDEAIAQEDADEADGQEQTAGTGMFADVIAPTYPAEITITGAGDVTLGGASRNKTDKKFAEVARRGGADYFFSNLRGVFEKDDLTIVNLEGPLTTATNRKKGQYYAFKGHPAYVQILSGSSVEICNVANNHALDYGMDGLKQTAQTLQSAGIGVSGFSVSYTTTIKGVRVTSLGFTKWDHSVDAIRSAVTKARRECDILVVSMHWGKEKVIVPDAQQREMGHVAVDAGADLVLGTHPHVYGSIEKYKGKYIVYSLGNFCFGGNPNPTDKRCLVFQQTLRYSPTTGVSDAGINIIPCTVSSSAKTNDYRPTMMGRQAGSALLRDVAKVSIGMSMANTIWMSDNYMVWSGITTQEQLDAASAAAMAANGQTAAGAGAAAGDATFQDETADAAFQDETADAAFQDDTDADDGQDAADWSAEDEDAGDEDDLEAAWDLAEPDEELPEEAADAEAEDLEDAGDDFDFNLALSGAN